MEVFKFHLKEGFFSLTTCSLLRQRLATTTWSLRLTYSQSLDHVSLDYTRHVQDARKMRPILCVYFTWVKLKHVKSNAVVGSVPTPLQWAQLPSLQSLSQAFCPLRSTKSLPTPIPRFDLMPSLNITFSTTELEKSL